jgi:hypothetical protein
LQNQLRILAIRLLLAYPLGADLSGVSDPQLEDEEHPASNQEGQTDEPKRKQPEEGRRQQKKSKPNKFDRLRHTWGS